MINIKKDNTTLILFLFFILPLSLFFGLGISNIFSKSNTSSLLSILITFIPILLHTFLLFYVNKGNDTIIKTISKFPKIISIPWIILILLTLFLIILDSYYQTHYFITNNYLTKTPELVIDLVLVLLLFYIISKDYNIALRVSFILIIMAVIMYLINILCLLPYINTLNLLPLYNYDLNNILSSSFIFFSLFTSPLFVITFIKKDNIKHKKNIKIKILLNIIISYVLLFILFFIILSILGINLINIFEYPEYIVLKKLKISFIERIENIGFCIWSIISFIIVSFSSLYIKDTINELFNIKNKYLKLITPLLIILLLIVIPRIIFSTNDFTFKYLFSITPYITFSILNGTIYLLFIYMLIKKRV